MIFDSVQDLNQDVISQIEQELDYRSYAHFNRILFQEGIPSFEKWIRIIRQSIQDSQSNYGGNIFRIVNETLRERQFDSFSNMPVDQNSSKFCSLKGNERSEKLYKHAQMLQEKKKTFHLVKVKEELDKAQKQKNYCNSKSQNGQNSQVFERLYKIPAQQIPSNKEDELDSECTFNPKINTEIKQSEVKIDKIPGFNSQMKRVQKAQQEKEYKQNFYEIQQAKLQGLNQRAKTEFSLSQPQANDDPIMYLDIKVAKGKIGRLAVRRGDDHKQLIKNFARTFQLQKDQVGKLEESLKQALQMLN